MPSILTPFKDNIICKQVEAKEMIGSIIVPEKHRAELNQGIVMDKGPDCSADIKVGDVLFFPLHTEARLTWNGVKLMVISESHIIGAIRETKDGE